MIPRDVQIVLFSATFPAHVYRYAGKFAPSANEITLQHEELTVEGIKQLYMDCANDEEKYQNLVQLYGLLTVGSSIIFVRVCISHFGYLKLANRQRPVLLPLKLSDAWLPKGIPLPP
jgi:superfamily II DNA/RNA helicase